MSGTSTIPCEEIAAQLWTYIDGELTSGRMDEIHRHLDRCAHCFPEYDFRRAFLSFLRRHRENPVPAGLRRRVFETLLEEESRGE